MLIFYASRKLLDREMRYSFIEMECLIAIIWRIDKFSLHLSGWLFDSFPFKQIIILWHTCGKPKLMKWSFLLRGYQFNIIPVTSTSSCEAAVLSCFFVQLWISQSDDCTVKLPKQNCISDTGCIQFSSRRYLCPWKSPYVLHPLKQYQCSSV